MQPAPGDGPLDRMWSRGRTTMRSRVARLRSKSFAIAQCALAAGIAWFVASDVLGHQTPFFAPIAAVVSLGTSYGQRLRRVAEVTIGVAVGVFLGDLLVYWLGSGAWQVSLVVALAMSMAFLLGGGPLLVTQAAVQSIVITTLIADPGAAFTRWTDALIGGCVALVAATVVPAAPLRRPREQASEVLRKVSALLRAAADVMVDGEVDARPRAAGGRPRHRLPDPGAARRRRRGARRGGLEPVPGAPQGRAAADGRAGGPAGPVAAQHPGAGAPGRGRGLPAAARSPRRTRWSPASWRRRSTRSPTSWPPTGWRSPRRARCWRSAWRPRRWSAATRSRSRSCSPSCGPWSPTC